MTTLEANSSTSSLQGLIDLSPSTIQNTRVPSALRFSELSDIAEPLSFNEPLFEQLKHQSFRCDTDHPWIKKFENPKGYRHVEDGPLPTDSRIKKS